MPSKKLRYQATSFMSKWFMSLQGLSLPLVREARGGLSSWFSSGKPPSSITDCLAAFTSNETLRVGAPFAHVILCSIACICQIMAVQERSGASSHDVALPGCFHPHDAIHLEGR